MFSAQWSWHALPHTILTPVFIIVPLTRAYHTVPGGELSKVSLVSIGGGTRDTLVRSNLAAVSDLVGRQQGFGVAAEAVPAMAGRSTDHLCILWCNQVCGWSAGKGGKGC